MNRSTKRSIILVAAIIIGALAAFSLFSSVSDLQDGRTEIIYTPDGPQCVVYHKNYDTAIDCEEQHG